MHRNDGLGDLWNEVVTAIESLSIAGCYERVNRIISLGLVNRLRRKASGLVSGRVIVDAGAGPGTSTRIVSEMHPNSLIIMLDPSGTMLSFARKNFSSPYIIQVQGRFENLPFNDNSVDGIVAMFSYRDAVSYSIAAKEFARVLKPNGAVSILDFYRPAQPFKFLIKIYLFIMVPIALLVSGCRDKLSLYKGFLATIDRMLTRRKIIKLFKDKFNIVKMHTIIPGLAIIEARNPKKVTHPSPS